MTDLQTPKPLYQHDCTNSGCCQFLFSTNSDDVYLYGRNDKVDTTPKVMLRHSDEPSDNTTYGGMIELVPVYIRIMIIHHIQKMKQEKENQRNDPTC
jgi:hypothetical protein